MRDWKEELAQFPNIQRTSGDRVPKDCLWTTRCSKTKPNKEGKAVPREFYVSRQNLRFYAFVESQGYRYAILSDLYGIHFDNEELDFYDIHPSELSTEQKEELGAVIRQKCFARDWRKLVFWNSSPLMSKPYFEMLAASGLEVYYITKLPLAGMTLF